MALLCSNFLRDLFLVDSCLNKNYPSSKSNELKLFCFYKRRINKRNYKKKSGGRSCISIPIVSQTPSWSWAEAVEGQELPGLEIERLYAVSTWSVGRRAESHESWSQASIMTINSASRIGRSVGGQRVMRAMVTSFDHDYTLQVEYIEGPPGLCLHYSWRSMPRLLYSCASVGK